MQGYGLASAMVMFDVQVSLPLDATTFLKEKDSDAYKAFHSDAMGTVEQELLSSDVIDGEYHTVTRMVPSIEIPWALRRAVLGNKRAEFIDKRRWAHGSHLTAPFSQTFHITNNITDRCVVTGTILIADETHGTCLVRAQGEAIVTMKGFGPAVEKLVVNNLKASYDKLPGIVERWMRRGESPAEQNNLSTQIMPNRMRTRTRRDSTRRTAAFGSVIGMQSVSGYDVETGGLAHGNNRYDDEFKSPEAKARAFGKSINFVARGRSLLANAFAGEPPGGETSKSRSLRTRGSNTRTTKRLSKHKTGRYICGVRRSTFLFLVFLSVVVYFWFSFLPTGLVGPGLFSLLSRDSAKLHKVEETVESVVEAELEVFDAVEHMAEDIEHGQEEAVERAVGHEHAARVAAEKDDAHRYIHADNDVSCVDTRAEECAMWACSGECSANPGFMNEECACACAAVAKHWIGNMDESIKPGTDADTSGVSFSVEWTSPTGTKRNETIRMHLHQNADAPKTLKALRKTVTSGRCAPNAFCGKESCHFHRAEREYGLVQGNLFGLSAAGGMFGKPRLEGTSTWRRGTVGYIPGGDDVLIATKPHPEWDQGFVAFGEVFPDDLKVVDEISELQTKPFTHPEYGTVMAMLETKVVFTLERGEG